MTKRSVRACFSLMLLMVCLPLFAQESGVSGYWREPSGSVIRIEECNSGVCAYVVSISPTAPTRVDAHNPDPKLRQRSLCGLRIGDGFQHKTPTRAENGTLYDPKTGKTYRGSMESHGNQLDLRGYIGFSFLGRTEKWSRTGPTPSCQL